MATVQHLSDGPGRHGKGQRPVQPAVAGTSAGTELVAPDALDAIRRLQESGYAENTKLGYNTDVAAFREWCVRKGYRPLPAEPLVVAAYLAEHAYLLDETGKYFYAPNTIGRWLASINKLHEFAGFPKPGLHPDVDTTMKGIRREMARPEARKAPLHREDLRRILETIDVNSWPAAVIGRRDRLLLLMGYAGAYRRSELAYLDLRDVMLHPEQGMRVLLRKSKTDQDGKGYVKALPVGRNVVTCAPCAFVRWVRILHAWQSGRVAVMRLARERDPRDTEETEGTLDNHICRDPVPELASLDQNLPLFRPVMKNGVPKPRPITGGVVNNVVKDKVEGIGLNPDVYGAHSLRAGFVTDSFRAGASHHDIMAQTGHTNITTVEIYGREDDPLRNNSVTELGL
jgi:site-specific recombinase XerD